MPHSDPAPSLNAFHPAPPWESAQFEPSGHDAASGTLFRGRQGDVPLELYWQTRLTATRHKPESIDRDLERLAALQHPNLVGLEQVGRHGGIPYQLVQRRETATLADRLSGWPWPHRAAVELITELLGGLAAAHEAGIGHFDLHPGQVVFGGEDSPRLMRFALAPPPPGTQVGRGLALVAPERWRDPEGHPELAEDVWAVGVLLYELLGGRPPFAGNDSATLKRRVQRDPHIPLGQLVSGLPLPLVRVVDHCLEKNPARRYDTATALRTDLLHVLSGELIEARGPGLLRRLGRKAGRHPFRTLGPAIAVLAAVAWGVSGWWQLGELKPQHFETLHRKEQAELLAERYQTGLRESMATLRRTGDLLTGEQFQFQAEAQPLREAIVRELEDFNGQLLTNNEGRQNEDTVASLARLQMADLQRMRGEHDEAVESYHQVMRVLQFKRRRLSGDTPSDDPQVLEALVACNRGEGLALLPSQRWEEALGCFDAAINLSNKVVEAGGGGPKLDLLRSLSEADRGRVQLRLGRLQAALSDLESANAAQARLQTATDTSPDVTLTWARAETLLTLGEVKGALGRFGEAVADLDEARTIIAERRPGSVSRIDPRPLLARVDLVRAQLFARQGNLTGARPLYQQAARLLQELVADCPTAIGPLADLATCQEALGEVEPARQTRVKLDELLPPQVTRPGLSPPSSSRPSP